jgi:predicted porin
MNKSLITFAILAAAAGAAAAQSSVTVYGKVDLGLRKAVGASNSELATGSDGRLGFKGTEDLGGGNRAFFNIEHRFFPNTGVQDGGQFWKGISQVGLGGAYGQVALGRQYVAAFSLIQNQIDPFGGDTVAQLRDVGFRVASIARTRVDNSIRYDFSANGLNVALSSAESTANGGPDRPLSVAANYKVGSLFVGAGYENPAGVNDNIMSLGAAYTLGAATLSAGYSKGDTNANVTAKGVMVGLNWALGSGELKAAAGTQKQGSTTTAQKVGLGYHHALSKRTTIYTDVGHDSKAVANKTGYDLGLKHTF